MACSAACLNASTSSWLRSICLPLRSYRVTKVRPWCITNSAGCLYNSLPTILFSNREQRRFDKTIIAHFHRSHITVKMVKPFYVERQPETQSTECGPSQGPDAQIRCCTLSTFPSSFATKGEDSWVFTELNASWYSSFGLYLYVRHEKGSHQSHIVLWSHWSDHCSFLLEHQHLWVKGDLRSPRIITAVTIGGCSIWGLLCCRWTCIIVQS